MNNIYKLNAEIDSLLDKKEHEVIIAKTAKQLTSKHDELLDLQYEIGLNLDHYSASYIKEEAIFMLLSGFAKSCYNTMTTETGELVSMIKSVNKYFNKLNVHKRYKTEKRLKIIGSYIANIIDPKLEALQQQHDGKTSPQILLVLALDYLVNEVKHETCLVHFAHYNYSNLIDRIYSNEKFKPYIKSHSDFIWGLR